MTATCDETYGEINKNGCIYGQLYVQKMDGEMRLLYQKLELFQKDQKEYNDQLKEDQIELSAKLDSLRKEISDIKLILAETKPKDDIQNRIFNWFVGGIIGAIIGYIVSLAS